VRNSGALLGSNEICVDKTRCGPRRQLLSHNNSIENLIDVFEYFGW
jgi:hypothetical protein